MSIVKEPTTQITQIKEFKNRIRSNLNMNLTQTFILHSSKRTGLLVTSVRIDSQKLGKLQSIKRQQSVHRSRQDSRVLPLNLLFRIRRLLEPGRHRLR